MAHLKRLLAPSFWKLSKKETKWVVTPRAGPHPKKFSIPLSIAMKHMIGFVDTTTEARTVIRRGDVMVDGKRRKDYAYPIGMFDAVSVPKINKSFRAIPTARGLELIEIPAKESNVKIEKIKNKTVLRKGKIQLNLHDGKTILVEKDNYKTGDSLLVELPSLKIIEHMPLEKGNVGIIARGTGAGKLGKIKELMPGNMKESQKVKCDVDKEERVVNKESFVVVGKDKPAITIS